LFLAFTFQFDSHRIPSDSVNFISRIIQLLGLIVAGYGLFVGLYVGDIKLELMVGAFGSVLFLIGWMLQKRVRS
jgi:hypothetical protein